MSKGFKSSWSSVGQNYRDRDVKTFSYCGRNV